MKSFDVRFLAHVPDHIDTLRYVERVNQVTQKYNINLGRPGCLHFSTTIEAQSPGRAVINAIDSVKKVLPEAIIGKIEQVVPRQQHVYSA